MNREDSLRFVQERLRPQKNWPLAREPRLRQPAAVRRRFVIELAAGEHHRLERVDESVLVRCTSGVLWITHDGDPKDVIMAGGDEYWAEREDAMHLFALRPCLLEIQFDDDVIEH